jgi:hypothetical protein
VTWCFLFACFLFCLLVPLLIFIVLFAVGAIAPIWDGVSRGELVAQSEQN